MKRFSIRSMQAVGAAAALFLLAGSAQAAPINFTVVEAESSLSIGIDGSFLGAGSGEGGASGSADVDVVKDDDGVVSLGPVNSSSITVEDLGPQFGNWAGAGLFADVQILGVEAQVSGPQVACANDICDLQGWTLSLTQGSVLLAGSEVFNFSPPNDPLELVLEESTPSVVTWLADRTRWEIPVDALVTFSTLGVTVAVSVAGTLVLEALKDVPEAGTLLLLGSGAAGLLLAGRRRRA